jgi:hypothetical protein
MLEVQQAQLLIFFRCPAFSLDAWVQMTTPSAHALLICAALAVPSNLGPFAHAIGADKGEE